MNHPFNTARPVRLYYGWIIIALAFLTLAVIYGIWYSYSVFILAVISEFGWSRAVASSVFSVFVLSHSFAGLAAGPLQDRFGPRVVIPTGAVLLSFALFLTSQSRSIWHYQLAFGLLAGIAMSLIAFNAHSVFIPKWFERKRGLTLGIAMSGIGFGMLLIVPLAERLISGYGWRYAYLWLAAIVLFGIGPLNLIFSRRNPESLNLLPDGDTLETAENTQSHKPRRKMLIVDPQWAAVDWGVRNAVPTRRFWYLTGCYFTISFANQGILLHSVSAMVDAGIERQLAAFYFGIAGIASATGKILFGLLSDLTGREKAKTASDLIAIVGILSLLSVGIAGGPAAILFGWCFGLGCGSAAALLPAYSADIFLGRRFGAIFALIAIGGGLGGASGTFFCGWLFDLTGTYFWPFMMCCLLLMISNLLIWLAAPSKIRRTVRV
jgi:MFS family permease